MRKVFAIVFILMGMVASLQTAFADSTGPVTYWFVNNTSPEDQANPVWNGHTVFPDGSDMMTIGPKALRRTSGQTTISFAANEAVLGGYIVLPTGAFEGCYLAVAPQGGTVISGVVNPWFTEIQGQHYCDLGHPLVNSGKGVTIPFLQGDNVVAFQIALDNGTTYSGCVLMNAPVGGKLTDGTRNPTKGQMDSSPLCQ